MHATLAYEGRSAAQQLDLYLPPSPPPHPLVVWLHGGGWMAGSRALAPSAAQLRLLDAGYALASVGYRLSGEACFPAQLEDAAAAVRWLRTNAARYHLGGWIAAWGASAGGHLAALLGVRREVAAVIDWFGPTDLLEMDRQTEEQGCPPFAGRGHDSARSPESRLMGFPIQDDPERVRPASPAALVTGAEPPFLIQHGTQDCTVPIAQSRLLHERLRAGGALSTLELLPAGHGGGAFESAQNLARLIAFLDAARTR